MVTVPLPQPCVPAVPGSDERLLRFVKRELPPHPEMHANAEWHEAYARWHNRLTHALLRSDLLSSAAAPADRAGEHFRNTLGQPHALPLPAPELAGVTEADTERAVEAACRAAFVHITPTSMRRTRAALDAYSAALTATGRREP